MYAQRSSRQKTLVSEQHPQRFAMRVANMRLEPQIALPLQLR